MTQLFLIATAVLIFIGTRRIYQRNFELFLIVLVVINFDFFHLISVLRFSDSYKLIIAPILVIYLIELKMQKRIYLGKYGGWIMMFFALLVFGILIAAIQGQPLILGIKAVKFYSLILIYFVIVNHKVDINKFIKYLSILAIVIAGLAAIQSISQGAFDIFSARNADEVRKYRVIEGSFVISTAIVLSFCNYLKKMGTYYLFVFLALFVHLVFVIQTRALMAGVILTCVLVYFIYNKFSFKAIAAFALVILILSLVVIPFVSFSDIPIVKRTLMDIESIRDIKPSKAGSSPFVARYYTYEYYLGQLAESPVFGLGFRSLFWIGNPEIYAYLRKGFALSDIGVMEFVIRTGLVGLTWLLFGLMRFIGIIVKGKELSSVGAYIILGITTIGTIDLFMGNTTLFMFGLFIGLMSNENIQNGSEIRSA